MNDRREIAVDIRKEQKKGGIGKKGVKNASCEMCDSVRTKEKGRARLIGIRERAHPQSERGIGLNNLY